MARTGGRAGWRQRFSAPTLASAVLLFLSVTPAAAAPIRYLYDAAGRLIAVVEIGGETARYQYDGVGNLLSIARQPSDEVAIIDFEPKKGPAGTTVRIYGTGFSTTAGQNTVAFNGTTAAVASASETEIVATVPAGATTGPISVTAPAGAATSSEVFTVGSAGPVVTSFSPTVGTAGTTVTITGLNFAPLHEDKVLFNTNVRLGLATSATPTTIVAQVPAVGSGRITVATPDGQGTSADDFFVPPPPYTAADVAATGRFSIDQPPLSLAIGTSGKIGLYVFDAAAGQHASLGFAGVTFGSVTLTLLDRRGAPVASTSVGTSGGDLDVAAPETGTYTLMVDPGGSNVGSLTLHARSPVTTPLTVDGPDVTISLQPGQDARLPFTGAANQRVSLGVSAITGFGIGCCNPLVVSIVTPAGTMLASTNLTTNGGDLDVLLPSAGTYTVVIDATRPEPGTATLTLTTPIATAAAVNGADVVVSLRPGQDARLPFVASAGGHISAAVGAISGFSIGCCQPLSFSIVTPQGSTLASRTVGTNGGDLDVLLPTAGTYTMVVDVPMPVAGTFTATVTAPVATALTIDGPDAALALRPGQDARLPFTGDAGQQASVGVGAISGFAIGCCQPLTLALLRPDGSVLTSRTLGTNGGDLDVLLPVAGAYTVLIDAPMPVAGGLTVTVTSPVATAMTADGPDVPTSLRPGQDARLPFSGVTGQRVSLGIGSITGFAIGCCQPLSLSILRPDGTALASASLGTAGGDLDVVLPLDGSYTIVIDAPMPVAGTLTVTLTTPVSSALTTNGPDHVVTLRPGQDLRAPFTGTGGEQVSVGIGSITGFAIGCCQPLSLSILRPDGTAVASRTLGTSGGDLDVVLPIDGTYTVLIDAPMPVAGTLTVALTGPITHGLTIDGPAVPVTLRSGQDARLPFTGSAGQHASLGINAISGFAIGCCNPLVATILKPDGTTLATVSLGTGGGDLDVLLPVTGTYIALVDAPMPVEGSFTATLTSPIATELVVDGPSLVAELRPGQNVRAPFQGAAGQRVSVGMGAIVGLGIGCCRPVAASIVKPDGTQLASVSLGTGGGDLDVLLPVAGTYAIVLDPDAPEAGAVTVTLTSPVATAMTVDGPSLALSLRPGQDLRAPFSGLAGQRVSVGVGAITGFGIGCCRPVATSILRPDGTPLASAGFGTGGGDLDVLLPVDGSYTIVIDAEAPEAGTATVTLTAPVSTEMTIDGPSLALTLRPGQDTWIPFAGTVGQRASVAAGAITGFGIGCCRPVALRIVKPDGTTLASMSLGPGGGELDVALPADGVYRIALDAEAPETGSTTITLTSPVTADIAIGGSALPVSLRAGQDLRASFTGAADQAVRLTVSGISGFGIGCCRPVAARILRPDGTTLASAGLGTGGGSVNATLPAAGIYTVVLDAEAPEPGSATVTLTNQ
ncbi:MAG TPA: IPT/TIG domain-containing protein [Candidatus Tectomicrobia bacterium]|nr:IPT/TIG domain-containing protein [Candidatus Tectomicrobia bacterium]